MKEKTKIKDFSNDFFAWLKEYNIYQVPGMKVSDLDIVGLYIRLRYPISHIAKRLKRSAPNIRFKLFRGLRTLYSFYCLPPEQQESFPTNKDSSIEICPLSIRARNALMNNGVKSINDLLCKSYRELIMMRNLGKKTLTEIDIFIYRFNQKHR